MAFLASCQAIAAGTQVAWLAPTGVVASQQAAWCRQCWQNTRVRLALLTGDTTADERRQILDDWQSGTLDLLLGTHALFTVASQAPRLGLSICDEEHKFGRATKSSVCPH